MNIDKMEQGHQEGDDAKDGEDQRLLSFWQARVEQLEAEATARVKQFEAELESERNERESLMELLTNHGPSIYEKEVTQAQHPSVDPHGTSEPTSR